VDLDSQIEGGRVLAAGVGEPAADQGELAQPVAGIRLAGQVAQLAVELTSAVAGSWSMTTNH